MFRLSGNKKLRRRQTGIVLNVKVSRQRKVRKFFSSSALKKVVVLVSFTALGVFGVIASAQGLKAFFQDPRYRVAQIAVYNQHFFTQKELLDMSGIALGMYPFDFSVKKAAREIEKNPNVKRASVERAWPNKVVIKVVERTPAAVVKGKASFMIDEDGVVLPMRAEIPVGLVTICGAELTEEMVGQKAAGDGMMRALSLLREYQHTDLPLTLEFSQIDISNPRNLVVQTRRNLRVLMGEGDFARRLARLSRVLEDMERRGRVADTIDLRFKDVVVQPVTVKADRASTPAVERGIPSHLPSIRIEGGR